MNTLLLVRHASCEGLGARLNGRAAGVRLSGAGRGEAERLAWGLIGEGVRLVMTSPRERCVETAETIATQIKAPIEIVGDLDEVDFGGWTGLAFSALQDDPLWREWNERRSLARPPGGESMDEVGRRMSRALAAASQRAGAGAVALVSHAEPIRAVLAGILGFSHDAWARLEISPAGVTRLYAGPQGLSIVSVNQTR